ncbi:MAG TPA: hypothetical protein VGH27_32070 [Streptosporangiaceae bacterium]|jgi:hypothetical protein
MPHSRVTKIVLKTDGTLALTIDLFGFEAGELIEVSGSATQVNGAIATFYDLQDLPSPGADGGSIVTATAAPQAPFTAADVITVVGRATKIWGTVLSAVTNEQPPGIEATWTAGPQT